MKTLFAAICLLSAALAAAAQSGVLLPPGRSAPDENVLALDRMDVSVCVDNQTVKVRIVQIFGNRTERIQEGKYLFALPAGAAVTDFAVWDGPVRLPGVMLEKRRANEIYSEIKRRTTDPGLLEIDDEAGGRTVFSVKVFPIPAHGTKRLEMEYAQTLAVENFSSHLTFPLKPSFGPASRIGEFRLDVCLRSELPLAALSYDAERFPLAVARHDAHRFDAAWTARDVVFEHDFALDYRLAAPHSLLSLIAYRAPESVSAYELRNPALAARAPDGYFELRALFNEGPTGAAPAPRRVLLLVDTSLSMAGEKLARAVEAADYLLHQLTETDEFNLAVFADEPRFFAGKPMRATPDNIERAMEFFKNQELGGGTNLKKTLAAAAAAAAADFSNGERAIVLVTDAGATRETTDAKRLAAALDDAPENLKIYALGLGSDAQTLALETLARKTGGFYLTARETEDVAPLLPLLLSKIGGRAIRGLQFAAHRPDDFYGVYATGEQSFDGSTFSFVGRYKTPGAAVLSLRAESGAGALALGGNFELPESSVVHDHLPRLWAQARIDALVREINLYGEREDFIEEIIALSQKYRIVSPYTAFLAAPRALLRPRLIQPGDPVIRVRTDRAIVKVFAVLPFGETLPLEYLAGEEVWETRFLAPTWLADGTYTCRLLLTDRDGRGYEETKTFVVDSNPPRLKVDLPRRAFRAGEEIEIRVAADRDTAKLTASLYGAPAVELRWSQERKASVGRLRVPTALASGKYVLTVAAEDFARNHATEEFELEILGN